MIHQPTFIDKFYHEWWDWFRSYFKPGTGYDTRRQVSLYDIAILHLVENISLQKRKSLVERVPVEYARKALSDHERNAEGQKSDRRMLLDEPQPKLILRR
jgi:hypothetical protein